jgi:hypothetical protein
MTQAAYTADQMTDARRQVEAGTPVAEGGRQLGGSEQPFSRRERRLAGTGGGGAPRAAARRGKPPAQAARGRPEAR